MIKIKKKTEDKGERTFVIWMTVICILLIGSYVAFLGMRTRPQKKAGAYTHTPLQTEVEDPVCEMKVKPPAAGHVEFRAKHYYFCSLSCKEDFEKDPEKYLHSHDKKEMK